MEMIYLRPIYIEGKKGKNRNRMFLKWNAGYSEDVLHIQIIFIKKMVVHMY